MSYQGIVREVDLRSYFFTYSATHERHGVTVKLRPPIFRKEIENEKKCANFKGKFEFFREMFV